MIRRETKVECSGETLTFASRHAIDCTLLPSITSSKVKVEVKGVRKVMGVVSLPKSVKIDSRLYKT